MMRKETYLSYLKDTLDAFEMSEHDKKTIIDEHASMVDEAIQKGEGEAKIDSLYEGLKPLKKDLQKIHPLKTPIKYADSINALTPFLSLAVFVFLGVMYDAWHPGWVVFLSVPLVAVIMDALHSQSAGKLIMVIPLLSVVGFLILGLFYHLWHPGWLMLMGIVMGPMFAVKDIRFMHKITMASPFVALIAFILIAHFTGAWHPSWLVFALVVFVGLFYEQRRRYRFLLQGALLVAITAYLTLGWLTNDWSLAVFAGLLFLIPAVLSGHIHVNIHGVATWIERTTLIATILVFYLWGYFFEAWAVAWVVFLAVPSISVILHAKGRDSLIPITVFLSIVVFYLIGYYTGAWHLAWLVFLAIPSVAILQNV